MIREQAGLAPTPQQTKLVQLLADGAQLDAACRQLYITRNTGKTHLALLSKRLERHGQIAVVVEMAKRGLISLDHSAVPGGPLSGKRPTVTYDLYAADRTFLGAVEMAVNIRVKGTALAQLRVNGKHIPEGDLTVGNGGL